MEKRRYGTNPMAECRHDSHEAVDKNKRYMQIRAILKKHKKGLTAREIALCMYKRGYVDEVDRNHAAPRLTEMCERGEVEPIGKTKCQYTGKTVTVYKLRAV